MNNLKQQTPPKNPEKDKLDAANILDVTGDGGKINNNECNESKQMSSSTLKCPCGESDPSSIYVKCAKCIQQWHNKCCNLDGLTQAAIRKLEKWQCPRCYTSPFVQTHIDAANCLKEFVDKMTRIERCNEDLNDSITSVEFFNMHIKHLLLDDKKFIEQTSKLETLSSDVTAIRKQVSELHKRSPNEELITAYKDVSLQVAQLSEQVEKVTSYKYTYKLVIYYDYWRCSLLSFPRTV